MIDNKLLIKILLSFNEQFLYQIRDRKRKIYKLNNNKPFNLDLISKKNIMIIVKKLKY